MAVKEETLTIKSIDDAIDDGRIDLCLELRLRDTVLTNKCKKCSFYSTYSLSCFLDFYRDLRVDITGKSGKSGGEMKTECKNPYEYRLQKVRDLDATIDSSFTFDGCKIRDAFLAVVFKAGECIKEDDKLFKMDIPIIKSGLKTVHSPCYKPRGEDCFFEVVEKGSRCFCLLNAYLKMRLNILSFITKYNAKN